MEYPVYCAWCLVEGKKTIVTYKEVEESHGICKKCKEEIIKEVIKDKDKIKNK